MRVFIKKILDEMIFLIVRFYEYYLSEFVILNDFYEIVLYIIYHIQNSKFYIIHHLHNK